MRAHDRARPTTLFLLAVALTLVACRGRAEASPPDVPPPAPPASVELPKPALDNPLTLEQALASRRSVRTLVPDPLTQDQVGRLLWAAQGVTDEKGHRTAPSARGTYLLDSWLVAENVTGLAPGLYRYEPAGHRLALVRAGTLRDDFVSRAANQAWIRSAPAIVVLTGAPARGASMGDRAAQFTHVEAGLAAQGFFLEAVALGLGSTYVGGFDPAGAASFLGLGAGEIVEAVLPVGRPAR